MGNIDVDTTSCANMNMSANDLCLCRLLAFIPSSCYGTAVALRVGLSTACRLALSHTPQDRNNVEHTGRFRQPSPELTATSGCSHFNAHIASRHGWPAIVILSNASRLPSREAGETMTGYG